MNDFNSEKDAIDLFPPQKDRTLFSQEILKRVKYPLGNSFEDGQLSRCQKFFSTNTFEELLSQHLSDFIKTALIIVTSGINLEEEKKVFSEHLLQYLLIKNSSLNAFFLEGRTNYRQRIQNINQFIVNALDTNNPLTEEWINQNFKSFDLFLLHNADLYHNTTIRSQVSITSKSGTAMLNPDDDDLFHLLNYLRSKSFRFVILSIQNLEKINVHLLDYYLPIKIEMVPNKFIISLRCRNKSNNAVSVYKFEENFLKPAS